MNLQGKAIKLGDNINTDFIISGRYKFAITDIKELAKHIMEDIDPDFPSKITPGKSVIAAGRNFGMGSSREQAPLVIKEAGIVAVLAESFGRIFYRNAFNIGLCLIETDTDKIDEDDILDIDLDKGAARNITKNINLEIKPFPKFMQELLKEGGIINYFKKYGELKVNSVDGA
ncbi:MAG: 3-isopropylmalate dehydratase [Candidatus Omnitrophica bacterium CG08_land_8_20_14_0_20_41_16]|uniref:3-isopropylmalate dehydratase small subunit n=1 Tax=Candidatus Sherwoodlollariibacterium unditelluris TaxID=1974757 RepID=A0A2G9YHD4_9BACT|nr:MAG: 3-isopropylmalate dehydratase [Candidatus Omnitrophica bacterium CG23_combo_of_CG06-09_8_20_14_all_41_10]PIS33825.1 MAG: 3-isopropylmalate dehydratase [Candidatus Omnitrophica bacterium CG08_land_8_20_14_0_20_41_16]